jgi:hypothetical protein
MCLLCAVPDKVIHQPAIKFEDIVYEVDVPIYELLLNGPVESFHITIGLGMLEVIEEVWHSDSEAGLFELLLEFTAIVSLYSDDIERRHIYKLPEKVAAVD